MNKRIILIIFIFIVIFFVITIALSLIFTGNKNLERQIYVTPTPYPQQRGFTKQSLNPLTGDQADKMLNNLKIKSSIPETDIPIKENLIKQSNPNKSGIIYSSPDFEIYYAADTDVFQVQILGEDTLLAQDKSISWLKQQGLSISAICNLPIVYLKFPKDNGIFFYPQPKECGQ